MAHGAILRRDPENRDVVFRQHGVDGTRYERRPPEVDRRQLRQTVIANERWGEKNRARQTAESGLRCDRRTFVLKQLLCAKVYATRSLMH